MAEWMFDKDGKTCLLYSDDCIRSDKGKVCAWLSTNGSVYSLRGDHIGWFEDGILYDSANTVLAFLPEATRLPFRPGLSGKPGKPGLAGKPGKPGFSGVPGRPGRGGYSKENPRSYFS